MGYVVGWGACKSGHVSSTMVAYGTPRALLECSSYVQTGHANWSSKLVMQTGRAALHESLWRTARVLVESCTSARGVPIAIFSLWVWGQGLGVCGRVLGHVAECGGMW